MLRRLLSRNYGIAVRRVGVRSEVSWHWRFLFWVALLSISFAVAGWVYDAGRRIAGYDRGEYERERAEALDRISALEGRLGVALEQVRASEGRLNVEVAAVAQLAQQVRVLQKENLSLKEELALFEGLVSSGRDAPGPLVRVPRVGIERVDAGRYRYRIILVHQATQKGAREFSGEIRFDLKVRVAGRATAISVPDSAVVSPGAFRLSFRHLHRAEGDFSLPADAEVIAGELIVAQDGKVLLRQPVSL